MSDSVLLGPQNADPPRLLLLLARCWCGPRARRQPGRRAVRMISSSPPAGASDILTRTLRTNCSSSSGQSFVVENRPGGGGIIGADLVAKSPPDGYTWLTTAVASQAINATLMPHQPYNPRKDFRHVTIIGRLPLVMLVNKDLPVRDLKEYVALAKSKPGKLNYGTGGVGTLHHLTGELLKIAGGIDIVHVPYRGAQASTQDLLGGRIESMFDSLPSAAPHIRSGMVRAIAVSGPPSAARRSRTFRPWPSKAIRSSSAPTGSASRAPPACRSRSCRSCMPRSSRRWRRPRSRSGSTNIGVEPGGDTPDATQAFVLAEIERWAKVVKDTGTTMN